MLVESGDSSVLVRFRSDYSHAGRGFRLEYSAICDTELTGLAGTETNMLGAINLEISTI